MQQASYSGVRAPRGRRADGFGELDSRVLVLKLQVAHHLETPTDALRRSVLMLRDAVLGAAMVER
jgi:hypothetical protein